MYYLDLTLWVVINVPYFFHVFKFAYIKNITRSNI
jgi:hypothetical protein